MAKPDLDDGFLMLAHELFAALACAGFSPTEWIVIRETLSQLYGARKERTAVLRPTDVSLRTAIHKSNLIRAIRGLVEARVLTRVGDCEYRFTKNYTTWVKPTGEPRIDAVLTAYCQSAKTINRSMDQASDSVSESTPYQRSFGVTSDTQGVNSDTATVSLLTPGGVTSDTAPIVPPGPPIGERARIENLRINKEKGGEDAPHPRIASLIEQSRRRWDDIHEPGRFVTDLCHDYDPAWVSAALDKAFDKFGASELPRRWVRTVLQGWFRQGGPPASTSPRASPKADPLPPIYVAPPDPNRPKRVRKETP